MLGSNGTSHNEKFEITAAEAEIWLFTKNTFNSEFASAFGDFEEGGSEPPIHDYDRGLNDTGKKLISVIYLFKPKTKF